MGARGPKPLPANVHRIRGNPSKLPAGSLFDEFRPEVEIPDRPAWIWIDAKREWTRITEELARYGLISKLDRAALILYVQAYGEYAWATKQLNAAMDAAAKRRAEDEAAGIPWSGEDGIMVLSPNGSLIYSHYWVVKRRAEESVAKHLAAFGLSPSARSRVTPSDNRQSSLFGDSGAPDAWTSL